MRSDIHRPSATEFDPAAYQLIGVFDLFPDPEYNKEAQARLMSTVDGLLAEGKQFDGIYGLGQCDHCGAHIRYGALMFLPANNGLIWVGETCLDNRFSLTKSEFDRLRKAAQLARERREHSGRVKAVIDSMLPDVRAAYDWATTFEYAHYIAKDIARKVKTYASNLSEKQEALLVKLHVESLNKAKQEADRHRQIAEGLIKPVPSGRVTITGTILAFKWVESEYTRGGVMKMTILTDEGYKVYGTCPSSIEATEKGTKVKLTASLEPSKDDPTFGFYSRPTKAEVLI